MKFQFSFRMTVLAMACIGAGNACARLPGNQPEPGFLMAVETIGEPLPVHFAGEHRVRYPKESDTLPPLRVRLSRERYWSEDGHLDAVIQLDTTGDAPDGTLRIGILDGNGQELDAADLSPPPGPRFIVHPRIPAGLSNGGDGMLEVVWSVPDGEDHRIRQPFRIERLPHPPETTGRIVLHVSNEEGVTGRNVPFTVGVPFPRGALAEATNLRLVSAEEPEQRLPLQAVETARWSRFGSVKWVLCDFTLDLDGQPRTLHLEYEPGIREAEGAPLAVEETDGFPTVDAGRIRFDRGLWFDPSGDGRFVRVTDESALSGAFVVRPDGRRYRVPVQDRYEREEHGAHKVVLRREGWYVGEAEDDRFCLYVTRYVIHRDSPLVRIFHTWIFTGDGNREHIANMGWSFPLAEGMQGRDILLPGDGDEGWTRAANLLQYDYEHFALETEDGVREFPGGRAPGAMRAEGNGLRLHIGARDFWQNYPSELEVEESALHFYNWPRRNRPAAFTFDGELVTTPGEPAIPSRERHAQVEEGQLTRSEWKLNVIQARFAHEGEHLDFRLPDRLAEDPIWMRSSANRTGSTYWIKGEPETANAQGISRTEEIWLYLEPVGDGASQGARILRGLNEETLRATVDPAWIAATGALYEIHPRDPEAYPEDERVFEQIALAPGRWIERLGLYGMWIFGDIAAWNPSLQHREPSLYRAFRKRHQGWPYSWVPFARSGDPRLLRLADASTRQTVDASYCHYVTDDIAAQAGEGRFRRLGRWHRSTLPWASRTGPSSRCYESQTDFLWHAWHLTGYHRARDNAMDWAVQTKREEDLPLRGPIVIGGSNRFSITMQKSYLDMYEATLDPWFLVAAHEIADGHLHFFRTRRYSIHGAGDNVTGASHFWRTGDRDYLRYTGRTEYRDYYLTYADFWGSHREQPSWTRYGAPMIEPNAHAWRLTGNPYYLRRVAKYLDWPRVAVFDAGEPDYLHGHTVAGQVALFTGWYLQFFPLALAVLDEAGARPDPVFDSFIEVAQRLPDTAEGRRYATPTVYLRKEAGSALPFSFSALALPLRANADETGDYRVTGPDGATVMDGSWRLRERAYLEIPEGAPAGTYRLQVGGTTRRGLEIPVSPVGTPEVIAWEAGQAAMPEGDGREVQYWFHVPEGLASFAVTFHPAGRGMRRMSVWTPDGECAWDRQTVLGQDTEVVQAEITVPVEQAGRLWRITLPGGGRFELDPAIPPALSVDPDRWFLPEPLAAP